MPERPAKRNALSGLRGLILLTCLGIFSLPTSASAQEITTNQGLSDRQQQITANFDELEKLMLKMADIDEANNPQRANLLREAVRNSRNLRVQSRMTETTDSLKIGQLKRASDQQVLIENDLRGLLKLLQSENRDEQIKDQEARIRDYIKNAQKLLNRQRSIQGRTEGGSDTKPLSEEQARLADDAKSLSDKIAEQEEGGRPSENADGQEGETGEEGTEKKPGEDNDGKSTDQDGKESRLYSCCQLVAKSEHKFGRKNIIHNL